MKKGLKLLSKLLMLFLILFALISCQKVPDEDVNVSRMVDFRINTFKATSFNFDEISDFLEDSDFKGNMVQIDYSRAFKNEVMNSTDFVKIIAAKGESNRASYKLWRHFATENDASLKTLFNTIPFLKGEYSHESEDEFIISWYDEKWFFFLKTSTDELREIVKKNLDTFFENDNVVNESVIGI